MRSQHLVAWFFSGLAVATLRPETAAASRRADPKMRVVMARSFAGEALATDALRPAERTFLERAAALARGELRLARLAVGQAVGSDVRSFATQLATDHQALVDAMEALRRRKGATAAPVTGPAAEESDPLAGRSGPEFDRAFVRTITEQHEELLTLFEQAASEARDADVRELAGSALPTLRDHRNKLVELRKALE
jgi:putative membrane protein